MRADEFAKLVKGARRRADGKWWDGRCPAHDDQHASLSFTDGDRALVVHCQAGDGCTREAIAGALGLDVRQLSNGNGHDSGRRISAVYDYRDERDEIVYQVVRYEPKDFRQRRPDGAGGWIWNLAGVERVLYRLPELIRALAERPAGQRVVFHPEGEKDADALGALGLIATTNVGGAGKWQPAYTASLLTAGVELVVILPDHDEPGEAHARQVARSCAGAGLSVKIIRLPGLPPKGDVSDWLAAGGTRAQLEALVDATPAATDIDQNSAATVGNLSVIDVTEMDLPKVTATAWSALNARNQPATLFRYGDTLARIERDDEDGLLTRELTADRLRHHLARSADWITKKGDTIKSVAPPLVVVEDLLADPSPPLPVLRRIVEVPVLGPDGAIVAGPGFDAASGVYVAPQPGLRVPPVPSAPTRAHVDAALAALRELLGEFPFSAPADYAAAVALFLAPFVRDLIAGPVPLTLIAKPSPGTGATLLVDVLLGPALGRSVAVMAEGRDQDEWRKRLTAALLQGRAAVVIDNVHLPLDSAALSAVLTAPAWEDRVLGATRLVRLPVRAVFVATGNNPQISTEIARRTVRVHLDAQVDRPWERGGFRHQDLRAWAVAHRDELVWSALVLARSWIAEGRPPGPASLGMFESWAATVGGILALAGIPGLLADQSVLYETADTQGEAFRSFLRAWHAGHGDALVTVRELMPLALASDLDIASKTERGQQTRLGKLIGAHRDQTFNLPVADAAPATTTVSTTINTTVKVVHENSSSHAAAGWRLATMVRR